MRTTNEIGIGIVFGPEMNQVNERSYMFSFVFATKTNEDEHYFVFIQTLMQINIVSLYRNVNEHHPHPLQIMSNIEYTHWERTKNKQCSSNIPVIFKDINKHKHWFLIRMSTRTNIPSLYTNTNEHERKDYTNEYLHIWFNGDDCEICMR